MKHTSCIWVSCALMVAQAGVAGCAADLDSGTQVEVGEHRAALHVNDTCLAVDKPGEDEDLPDRTNRVMSMVKDAEPYIYDALDDLQNIAYGGDRTRYEYWFGPWEKDTFWSVYRVFEAMIPWPNTVEFGCDCEGYPVTLLAWGVEQGDPNEPVNFCRRPTVDWDYLEFGVGSVLHELSHLANTSDVFRCPTSDYYWPDGYHELAQAWPGMAVNDAEMYRLYAMDWHPGQPSSKLCGE
jgi:hypothetical protein